MLLLLLSFSLFYKNKTDFLRIKFCFENYVSILLLQDHKAGFFEKTYENWEYCISLNKMKENEIP